MEVFRKIKIILINEVFALKAWKSKGCYVNLKEWGVDKIL